MNKTENIPELNISNILPEIFEVIVENLLDYEDPALVSASNKHFQLQKTLFPWCLELQPSVGMTQDKHNPPDLFGADQESLELDPPNTKLGFKRSLIGYHNVLQLRLVSTMLKQKVDQIPFVTVRGQIDKLFTENLSELPNLHDICITLRGQAYIAELKSKWPRILSDYVDRFSKKEEEKQKILNMMNSLHKSITYTSHSRQEDYNGEVYGKTTYARFEFDLGTEQAVEISIRISHCWDVRHYNWYTEVSVTATNKNFTPLVQKSGKNSTEGRMICHLLEFEKDEGDITRTEWNPVLTTLVCNKLGLNENEWRTSGSHLLIEFFLLAAGESKFTHFVPIVMGLDKTAFERNKNLIIVDADNNKKNKNIKDTDSEKLAARQKVAELVKEFQAQFLSKNFVGLRSQERYLMNIRNQLDASDALLKIKKNAEKLEISKYIDSISYIRDISVDSGEYGRLDSFYIKATIKTEEGGEFVIWALEKVGMGYHTPSEYVAFYIMPLNRISAQELKIEIGEQKTVYYHFNEAHIITDQPLCENILKHWKIRGFRKKKVESESDSALEDSMDIKYSGEMTDEDEEEDERSFLTIFNEVMHIRRVLRNRQPNEDEDDDEYSYESGKAYDIIRDDWDISDYAKFSTFGNKKPKAYSDSDDYDSMMWSGSS